MNIQRSPQSGRWRYSLIALAISLPIAIAVPAILYGLFWGDITDSSANTKQMVASYRGFHESGLIFQDKNGTKIVSGVPSCDKVLTPRNIGESFVLHFQEQSAGEPVFVGLSRKTDEAMFCHNGQV